MRGLLGLLGLSLLLFPATAEAGCPFALQSSTHGFSHHRHLLQANCALQFNGQPQTFKACQDNSAAISSPYKLYWTLTDEGNGSSIMSAALDAQSSSGWVAFGLPKSPGSGMLGGSAIVVKSNTSAPSGVSVDDYYLGGYSPALVQPPGKLDVLSVNATRAINHLQALFQIRLPGSGAALSATPTSYLMAIGLLDPSGNLMQHHDTQGVEGTVNLGAGLLTAATAPASTPKAAAPAIIAAAAAANPPTPVIFAVQPAAAQTAAVKPKSMEENSYSP